MSLSKRIPHPSRLAAPLVLAALTAGCGQKEIYPVRGQIVDMHGAPATGLKGGAVEFEGPDGKSSANGGIDEDGRFTLTTKQNADGARVGKNRVAITKPYFGPERPAPQVIDPKYEKFATSGLEVTIEPKSNDVKLTVELYQGPKK